MPRTSRLITAAAMSLVFVTATVIAQVRETDAQLVAFERKIEQGKYTEVEGGLMKFVIANQGSARGFQALARVRLHQERFPEARGLYLRAVAIDKGLVAAKLELSVVELRLGQKDAGLARLSELASSKLSNEDRLRLAHTFILFGEFKASLGVVSVLSRQLQDEAALPIRAICHLELGEDQLIAALVGTAQRLAVKNPAIAIRFAEALAGTRFNKDAMVLLRKVVAAQPKNLRALVLLAKVEINEREVAAAKVHVSQAAAIAPGSAEVAFAEALLANAQGDPKAALAQLEKALLKAPDSVPVMRELVVAAMRANQPPRAIEIARKLMAAQSGEAEFVYLYGAATLQIGRFTEAEEYLTKYVNVRPQDARGCVALGISLVSQPAKLTAGQGRLEQCLADHPTSFEAAFQLGLAYKDDGESERAIKLFEQALRIAPEFVPALRELGTLQLQAGQAQKARVNLEKAVAIDPNDPNTHFQLSRLYNLSGEAERAKIHFAKFQALRVTN